MRKIARIVAIGLLLAACATTQVETSWKDPAAGPSDFAFQKVLVMVRVTDGAVRRAGEDDLADREKARALVEAQGFDGLVLMSFVSAQEKVTVQPPSYGMVWGYYGTRAIVTDPGYARTDTILRVETTIYRVSDGKLLWTGISRALNPRDVKDLVGDVAKSVGDELRGQGLIP